MGNKLKLDCIFIYTVEGGNKCISEFHDSCDLHAHRFKN